MNIELRQKLHHYIENANEKKVKAIFTMVEEEIKETYAHWDNEQFIAELLRREQSHLNNTSKKFTRQQSASRARNALK